MRIGSLIGLAFYSSDDLLPFFLWSHLGSHFDQRSPEADSKATLPGIESSISVLAATLCVGRDLGELDARSGGALPRMATTQQHTKEDEGPPSNRDSQIATISFNTVPKLPPDPA